MIRVGLQGVVLVALGACAGYCPVDHSGLEAPALWSADGRSRLGAGEHAGGQADPQPH